MLNSWKLTKPNPKMNINLLPALVLQRICHQINHVQWFVTVQWRTSLCFSFFLYILTFIHRIKYISRLKYMNHNYKYKTEVNINVSNNIISNILCGSIQPINSLTINSILCRFSLISKLKKRKKKVLKYGKSRLLVSLGSVWRLLSYLKK